MSSISQLKQKMGWMKDRPDIRDFSTTTNRVSKTLLRMGKTETVKQMVNSIQNSAKKPAKLPVSKDLRPGCSPIEDQESIGSCCAHAVSGMLEFMQKKAFGTYTDASRLFLYKVMRKMLHWTGDTGCYLRTAMGSLAVFGAPPEEYWPYDISQYDAEPSVFAYAYAQNFQAISYYRLDPLGTTPAKALDNIKEHIGSMGIPVIFGFSCYDSLQHAETGATGNIPFPETTESNIGGHAIVAVGYDDKKEITHPVSGTVTKGALIIRNSWGTSWGEAGYGYLPYEYVLSELADDFWVMLKNEWIETDLFKQ